MCEGKTYPGIENDPRLVKDEVLSEKLKQSDVKDEVKRFRERQNTRKMEKKTENKNPVIEQQAEIEKFISPVKVDKPKEAEAEAPAEIKPEAITTEAAEEIKPEAVAVEESKIEPEAIEAEPIVEAVAEIQPEKAVVEAPAEIKPDFGKFSITVIEARIKHPHPNKEFGSDMISTCVIKE